ncbi:MAG: zinc ribbon domain-containing protein [Acidobacteria bacterium]|nr:zinc ribbon domain-containing protein [Acidobacteriota bacterium]
MPIFEYRCSHCSHRFEKLILKENDIPSCPKCGSSDVEKLFSTFGVQMKGEGFSLSSSSCSTCSSNSCRTCGK